MGAERASIFDTALPPADWLATFAAKGIVLSERTLRAKARQLGACYVLGKSMLITPEQIDLILEDSLCRSNRISEAQPGGRAARSITTAGPSRATSARALVHLTNAARGTGSKRGRTGNVVGISSGRKSAP